MKRVITIFLITLGVLMMVSCNISDKDDDNLVEVGYTTVYPESVSGALHNKGMGWVALEEQTDLGKLDYGTNGTIPEVDVIGIQTSWALIEKEEGVFDFDLIDKTIEYWTSLGKRINFRIVTDSLNLPEVFYGAPKWINEAPYNVPYEEYVYSGSAMARVNDLTDKTYQQYFERFLDKLAERYSDNPYLDTVDIRGFGMWGEWHSGHSFKDMEERMFTLAYIVDQYALKFNENDIVLLLSNSWDYQGVNDDGSSAAESGNSKYTDYLIWSALDHGFKKSYVSFRRDGVAGNGVTKYQTDEKLLNELIYSGKKVPTNGEFFSGFSDALNMEFGMDPIESVEEMFFKMRFNYATVMGWIVSEVVNMVDSGYEDVLNRGNQIMGYRFKTLMAKYKTVVAPDEEVVILTKIANQSLGRFTLKDHYLSLVLIDENGIIKQQYTNKDYDLRILLNGEIGNVYNKFKIDKNLSSGDYTLGVAIVDKNNDPQIRLGQIGDYDRKIYPLGQIKVGNKTTAKKYYDEVDLNKLSNYKLSSKSTYEITFKYKPTFDINDYEFGSENSYMVVLKDNHGNKEIVASFQDVSLEEAYKTITLSTGNALNYTIEIYGTGEYENKISVSELIVEKRKGHLVDFENDYDLLSYSSPWYSEEYDVFIIDDEDVLSGSNSVILEANQTHGFSDLLKSDPNLLSLEKNTNYSISFLSKGYQVGGNASYYYLKLYSGDKEVKTIAEWYDRPDFPKNYKNYYFTTTNDNDLSLVFGIKNKGGFIIDNINITENERGYILKGEDVLDINNEIVYNPDKLENGYKEGFEGGVIRDATFTYGFNRWGHLTKDPLEVISGNYSLTSRLSEEVYQTNKDSNWFEFGYLNHKYIKLAANGTYKVTFDYKIMEPLKQNTNPDLNGYGYFLARSRSGTPDVGYAQFALSYELDTVYTFEKIFTLDDTDDYYLILGMFGRGVIIVDDIVVERID